MKQNNPKIIYRLKKQIILCKEIKENKVNIIKTDNSNQYFYKESNETFSDLLKNYSILMIMILILIMIELGI